MRRLLLVLFLVLVGGSAAAPASAAGGDLPGWTPVSCSCSRALSIDAVDSDRVYLGTDRGVSRSDDGGFTWRALPVPVGDDVTRVSFANRNDGAAVGRFEGVIVTHDGGTSWKQYRPWPGRSADVQVLEGRMFGLSTAGLYTSTDGGIVWKQVHGAFPPYSGTPRMDWSSQTDGIVVTPFAMTTTDGGVTFTDSRRGALFAFDALSLGPGEGVAVGQDSRNSGRPWVDHITGTTGTPYPLERRGVADEQERGIVRRGSTLYVVGVEGLIARSSDAGATWAYEKTPPSFERSSLYDVDALDAEHAWAAVYSGRVLIRNASRVHDVTTSPHAGLGAGLLGLAAVAAAGGIAVLATGRPKPVAGVLAGVVVAAAAPGLWAVTDSQSCRPSGCAAVLAQGEQPGAVVTATEAPSPTPSPTASPTATPSATPSPTPSATPSPTRSATPSPTPSSTPKPTPLGAFTVTPAQQQAACGGPNYDQPQPVRVTLRNTTAAPVAWTASARELGPDQQQPWATLSSTHGTVPAGGAVLVTVTPQQSLCATHGEPTTWHVDVVHGVTTSVAVTVVPQT